MTFLELDLSFLFLIAVILIWFMIAYQFVLTVFGFINFIKSIKEKILIDSLDFDFPSCTILIPAHNEETVIAATIESMLKLNYPKDKLKILIINDGSTDNTKQIIQHYMASDERLILYDVPKGEGGKGKSRALNLGIKKVNTECIAIYDADNTPDENSLKYLTAQLIIDKKLGAVLGKFRTVNKKKNLLTRFINIETLSFQSMLQAGRWQLNKIATLPGTNFVMRTDLIKKLNGWDEAALTEDSELSIRIYEEGYLIKFIPYAVTYEQEPEKWSVFIKQRTRWVSGNFYVIGKFFKEIPKFKNKRLAIDLLYTLSLYYIFFVAIIISDVLFFLSAFNIIAMTLPGPYTVVWITAIILFIFEITLAISFDNEENFTNLLITFLMYFTYCQLWIFIMFRAIYKDFIKKEKWKWEKTVRFTQKQNLPNENNL